MKGDERNRIHGKKGNGEWECIYSICIIEGQYDVECETATEMYSFSNRFAVYTYLGEVNFRSSLVLIRLGRVGDGAVR